MADLLQMKPKGLPGPEAARLAVLADQDTANGVHDLRPIGPWPPAGTVPAVSGRVPGMWGCSWCGKTVADACRECNAARQPCRGATWRAELDVHELAEADGGMQCRRCQLVVPPHHVWQSSRQQCPVPRLHQQEEPLGADAEERV